MRNAFFSKELVFFLIVFLCLMFTIAYSPLITWCICLSLLCLLTHKISRPIRIFLSLIAITCASIAFASRIYFHEPSDDFIRYFGTFLRIYNKDYQVLFHYGSGLEIGLPSLYVLFAYLNPSKSPVIVLFLTIFSCSALYILWYEMFGNKILPASMRSACIALSLALFSYSYCTQTTRQMFSCVILLFAFSHHSYMKKIIMLAFAMAFHLPAIIFFVIFETCKKLPFSYFIYAISAAFCIFLGLHFTQELVAAKFFIRPINERLASYLLAIAPLDLSLVAKENQNLIFILLLNLMFLILPTLHIFNKNMLTYFKFCFCIFLLTMFSIPYSLLSIRMPIIINAVLAGYLIFILLASFRVHIIAITSFLIFYKTIAYMDYKDHLWHTYNWIEPDAFYYIKKSGGLDAIKQGR